MENAVTLIAGLWALAMGAAVASFLCVVAERVPRGEGLGGRSHCVCGRQLSAAENIPVAAFVVLGGRARCCGAALPRSYVATEAGLGVAWAGAVWVLGVSLVTVPVLVAVTGGALALNWPRG